MSAPPPASPTVPPWILPTLCGLALTVAGWAIGQSNINERRLTALETWQREHTAWAVENKAQSEARFEKFEAAENSRTEKTNGLINDIREDVAAIRGALNIPKHRSNE